MQEWCENGAADGFNVMCPVLPGDLQSFADLVLPELDHRDLRSAAGPHSNLRRRYGLPSLCPTEALKPFSPKPRLESDDHCH